MTLALTPRNARMLEGMKLELVRKLVEESPDFAFEVEVRGIEDTLATYTYNQLRQRLIFLHP